MAVPGAHAGAWTGAGRLGVARGAMPGELRLRPAGRRRGRLDRRGGAAGACWTGAAWGATGWAYPAGGGRGRGRDVLRRRWHPGGGCLLERGGCGGRRQAAARRVRPARGRLPARGRCGGRRRHGLDRDGLLREHADGIAGQERRQERRDDAVDEQRTARGHGETLLIPAGPRDVARQLEYSISPHARSSPETGGRWPGGRSPCPAAGCYLPKRPSSRFLTSSAACSLHPVGVRLGWIALLGLGGPPEGAGDFPRSAEERLEGRASSELRQHQRGGLDVHRGEVR